MAAIAPGTDPHEQKLRALRRLIASQKRWDLVFACIGVACLMVGVLTLVALFVDMAIDGVPRLNADFFSSFPSRRAQNAGILSAMVGSTLVMLSRPWFRCRSESAPASTSRNTRRATG